MLRWLTLNLTKVRFPFPIAKFVVRFLVTLAMSVLGSLAGNQRPVGASACTKFADKSFGCTNQNFSRFKLILYDNCGVIIPTVVELLRVTTQPIP